MTYSVRERVLQQIESKLRKMVQGDVILLQNSDVLLLENGVPLAVETGDPYRGVFFEHVTREELDRTKKFQGNSIAVIDMDEFYVYQTCYLECTLRVGLEFWYKMEKGDVASTQLGHVLAQLKRVFLSDTNLLEDSETGVPPFIQLCENVRIVEASFDIEGPFEKVVSGFAQFDFVYRTNKEDPYALM
jgi:hypothetical protein